MLTKKTRKILTSQAFLLFIIIFFVSAIFRITNLDLIEFKTDEAINLLLASRPLFGHPFVPGGTVSSVGILNPPFFNYILFPFTFLTLDPRGISFIIGLLNSLAIAFFFLTIKKYYGTTIAVITTILIALSPWSILYSRKIWTQNLLFPFFIPLFFSIHKLMLEKKMFYWLVYTASSLFLIQLHQASIIFILITTIFLLFKKIRLDIKYIIIGFIIGFIPLIPYLVFQLQNSCPDCKSIFTVGSRLRQDRSLLLFARPFQILGQGDFRFILGDDVLTLSQKFPFIYQLRKILYIEYLIFPIGLFIFIRKYKKFSFFAYASILLPIVYFLLKIEALMHYFIIILPLLFLFLATGFTYFIQKKNVFIKAISLSIFILVLITSILFNYAFNSLIRVSGSLKGDYGTSFLSQKYRNEKYEKYKKQSDFEEIILSSYIPLDYIYGFMPLGQMLYPGVTSSQKISILEKKLQNDPDNPRIKQELFTLYTKSPPTVDTITVLRKKTDRIIQYEPLYKEVLGYYLGHNFKKEYKYSEAGIRFFYPEHWKIEKSDDKIIISGDTYSLQILKNGKILPAKKAPVLDEIIKSIRPL